MPATTEAFINKRATMLANVFLTRKPTIQVNRLDLGKVQLLVNDLPDEPKAVRSFGVILWGTAKKLANEEDATKYANSHWRGGADPAQEGLPRFFMPILVLVFSVEEDLGYYRVGVGACARLSVALHNAAEAGELDLHEDPQQLPRQDPGQSRSMV
jgi:hypothetical protein